MLTILQKIFTFLFGHAVVDHISDSFKSSGKKVVEDAVNKSTQKDLVMGVINARLATMTKKLTAQEIADGIDKFNHFYASLNMREERDLFEILFYRDTLDAIQESVREQKRAVQEESKNQKSGKTTKVTYTAGEKEERKMHQTYLALVGLSGPDEIRLEMQRLNQSSPLSRVIGKIKNATEGTGDNASRLLNAFINGLEGK